MYLFIIFVLYIMPYSKLVTYKFIILGNVHSTAYFTYIVLYIMLHPMLYNIIVQVHLVMLKTERICSGCIAVNLNVTLCLLVGAAWCAVSILPIGNGYISGQCSKVCVCVCVVCV